MDKYNIQMQVFGQLCNNMLLNNESLWFYTQAHRS